MAEIRVEKKDSPIWPWILIALLVLGVIIYFVFFHDTNGDTVQIGDDPVGTEEQHRERPINNQTVAAYVSFVQERDREMGLDHEYSNEALKRLTEATKAMADEVNVNVERDLSEVRENAREIQEDPFETTHANKIRASAEKLSDALRTIQQEAFPNLSNEASSVRDAAMEIDPQELALEQRDEIKSFYDRAADLLQRMNTQNN